LNTNSCEIGFVLDRSGSMNAMKEEAIGGINAFLESQQKLPGEARLTLVLFDHEYIVAHHGVPIKDVPPLDNHSYVPRGQGWQEGKSLRADIESADSDHLRTFA
jgi:hypothetical protein